MQTHQDIWFSVSDEEEHIYFRAFHKPNPILDFLPWPIRVPSIVFPDGSSMNTAGGGGGGSQTPWLSDIDGNGFNLDSVSNLTATTVNTQSVLGTGENLALTGNVAVFLGTGNMNTQLVIQEFGEIDLNVPTFAFGGFTADAFFGFTIQNLPTSPAGLPAGALWNNGGVVNIV